MDKASNPIPIRLNEEDSTMLDYLRKRLGMKNAQVFRLAIRRLFQAEKMAEKKEAK